MDCRVIWTPAIFGCSLAEIFKWLKFGVWNEHCKFAWDQFQRSASLATDTMTHTVEVAEIANLGLVFLLFMIGWETQFFASKLDQWFAHLPRNKFHGFLKAWSWMFTRSFALLGQSPWQVSIANTFQHLLCRRCRKENLQLSIRLRWDEWFCSRDSSNFLCALEQGP